MFAGVSGLRSHQTMMDVVGNNIANVNTPGFKSSQITFAETISQTLRGASGASGALGGTNPIQIGLGTKVQSIDPVFSQGASQVTGRNTDLAIQGAGFFMVQNGAERLYTRAGAFNFDEVGNLVNSQGYIVAGWTADAAGNIDTTGTINPITIPLGNTLPPAATTAVDVGGNLSADATAGDTVTSSISVFDSIGNQHEVVFTFTNTSPNPPFNDWTVQASVGGVNYTLTPATLTFDGTGALTSASTLAFSGFTPPGAAPLSFSVELGGANPITQFGGTSTMEARDQDGQGIGFLRDFAVADDGTIVGQFSNGESRALAQVATATFSNPAGLARVGDSNFTETINSGVPFEGTPGSGNRGLLSAGTLEMSNVELAREFTNLIIAQRGFQANSRIITASDEMLADLVNMKR